MTSDEISDRVTALAIAIEAVFPNVEDPSNFIAMVSREIWNGEEYPHHNIAFGDRASTDRVEQFLAAVDALRAAAEKLTRQAAVNVEAEGRINVAAMALHSLGSLVQHGEDQSDAACIERGRIHLATELNDPIKGDLASISERFASVISSYPVRKGRQNAHRQDCIAKLLELFCFFRKGAGGPPFSLNKKGDAIGKFTSFYRRIEGNLPHDLRFSTDESRKAALGAALRGLSEELRT